jgi:hypothetical protein
MLRGLHEFIRPRVLGCEWFIKAILEFIVTFLLIESHQVQAAGI